MMANGYGYIQFRSENLLAQIRLENILKSRLNVGLTKIIKIEKKAIDYATASELSYDVIKTEYHKIFKHLGHHKVNRSLLGIPELISENELGEKYTKIFATLENLDFVVVKIPPQYEIENLYEFIREDIKK